MRVQHGAELLRAVPILPTMSSAVHADELVPELVAQASPIGSAVSGTVRSDWQSTRRHQSSVHPYGLSLSSMRIRCRQRARSGPRPPAARPIFCAIRP